MSCLDPSGERPPRYRLWKLFFFIAFMLSSSQLFVLLFHLIRLICYAVLDSRAHPPKQLPTRTSLFGIDLLRFESGSSSDDSTLIHVAQAVAASIGAILLGTVGTNAICREQTRVLKVYSVILLLVAFVTGFGAISAPNLASFKQVTIPVIGGALSSLVAFSFGLVVEKVFSKHQPQHWQTNDFIE